MNPELSITLCRHGATDQNLEGVFLSTDDPWLNARGRAQCERVRESIREMHFDFALTSPMRRCLESLSLVAPELEFEINTLLIEVDFGSWNGKTRDWLEAHDPDGLARRAQDPVRFRPPDGESFEDVARRLHPFLAQLHDRTGNVLVVGHRGTLGVLERLLRGFPLESQRVTPLELAEFRVLRADLARTGTPA
jgi:broad specificity phosphatase PhoE